MDFLDREHAKESRRNSEPISSFFRHGLGGGEQCEKGGSHQGDQLNHHETGLPPQGSGELAEGSKRGNGIFGYMD